MTRVNLLDLLRRELHNTSEVDRLRRELLNKSERNWIAVVDLYRCYRYHDWAPGTLSRALARLVKDGDAVRRWDGNERFGRYLG
jgi:hypothetical protein